MGGAELGAELGALRLRRGKIMRGGVRRVKGFGTSGKQHRDRFHSVSMARSRHHHALISYHYRGASHRKRACEASNRGQTVEVGCYNAYAKNTASSHRACVWTHQMRVSQGGGSFAVNIRQYVGDSESYNPTIRVIWANRVAGGRFDTATEKTTNTAKLT